jgi:DNA-binding NarL/FixJ family response regulator
MKAARKIRVLLADDHRMFLAGLQKLLELEFEVVGAVDDGRALIASAGHLKPDVIVADISMPSLNGIEAAQQLKAKGSPAKLIFLTMHADPLFVREALRCGASGYVLKRDAPDELVVAIRKVFRGKTYFTPDLVMTTTRQAVSAGEGTLGNLTARQREVFQLAAEGRTLKEIASAIHVSVKTAEFHKYNLMQRLGARTSADLTALAIKHGLISA